MAGPDGEPFTVQAATFVLAAGGLENPRSPLASTARSAAGVGNEHYLVGGQTLFCWTTDEIVMVGLGSTWYILVLLVVHVEPTDEVVGVADTAGRAGNRCEEQARVSSPRRRARCSPPGP